MGQTLVMAGVVGGARQFQQVGYQFVEALALLGDHLHDQQAHEHPVAFGDMALEGHAAGFLAPDQDITSEHEVGNVVEPDGGLDHLEPVARGQPVDHARRGNGLDDPAGEAAHFHQVADRQSHDAVRIDELAAAVHGAYPVGIAVGRHAQLAVSRGDGTGQRAEIAGNRLRVNASETRIHLAANLKHLAARALKNAFDLTPPRAEHRIDDHMLRVVGNGVEIDQRAQVFVIRGCGIEALD